MRTPDEGRLLPHPREFRWSSSGGGGLPISPVMTPFEERAVVGSTGAAPLVFGDDADATVVEHRSTRAAGLSARERVALAVVGGGFLAVLAALVAFVPVHRDPGLEIVLLYVAVYALVSRIEFEVFTGASVPTQLVLVPMLFVLPLRLVPVAVAGGLVLCYALDWLSGRIAPERIALSVVGSWHAVGPVLVLAVIGERTLAWSSVPIYLVALAAPFALGLGVAPAHER